MSIKNTIGMWTLPSENEQAVGQRITNSVGTFVSREFFNLARFAKAIFILDIASTTGPGTFTLDVTIQGFNEVSGKWHTVVTFPQQTAASPASPLPANSNLVQPANIDFTRYRTQWVTTNAGGAYSATWTLVAIVHTEEAATE